MIEFIRRLKSLIDKKADTRTSRPPDLPESGRSSVEEQVTLGGGHTSFDKLMKSIDPLFPVEWLDFLTNISIVNPDFSEAISNFEALGNPGHQVVIEGNDATVQRAIDRINGHLAFNLYKRSIGVDGLINQYIRQAARSGAVSSEDVLTPALDGVHSVAIIPVAKIRFKYIDGEYRAFQKVNAVAAASPDGDVELNPVTYAFFGLNMIDNSPYPIPPAMAAIFPIQIQHKMFENLDAAVAKIGLMGFFDLKLTPPRRLDGESETEWHKRCKEYATKQLEIWSQNLRKGIMAHWTDQELKREALTTESRGVKDIVQMNEEQVFSGMGTPPSMHGRTYSTTETYGAVSFALLLRKSGMFQMLAKRRMEQTYRLDLTLQGIQVDSLSLSFEKALSMDPLKDAQAEQIRQQMALERKNEEIISPDQCAQELGYDQAFSSEKKEEDGDGELKRKLFRFSNKSQQYVHVPEVIYLNPDPDPDAPGKKKLLN